MGYVICDAYGISVCMEFWRGLWVDANLIGDTSHTTPISKPGCMGNILGMLPILRVLGVFQELMETSKTVAIGM